MGNRQLVSEIVLTPEEEENVLNHSCTVEKLLQRIENSECKNIVVAAGAGISVSCGIPDFRSPGTGLYDNLQKYNLPTPQHVFDISYFKATEGKAFYLLAKEMWPDNFKPSPTHAFIKLLDDKGLLLRCYTQNIDTFERATGLDGDKIIEAHGSFASASCTKCKSSFDQNECKRRILEGEVPLLCSDESCGGLVKPDIVFFGEGLPERFHKHVIADLGKADLLIVMGTSLTVQPFAGLIHLVQPTCPRLLLNMVPVGIRGPGTGFDGLRLLQSDNYRDCMIQGSCDDAVRAICDRLQWRHDLETLVETLECKNKKDVETIDWITAFPKMKSWGIDFNWRKAHSSFPSISLVTFLEDWSSLEICTEDLNSSEEGLKLYVIGKGFNEFKFGDDLYGLLCITGEPKAEWDEDDYLCLVPGECDTLTPECHVDFSYLRDPEAREEVNIHVFNFSIPKAPDGKTEQIYDIWYVSNEKGEVTSRFGSFKVSI